MKKHYVNVSDYRNTFIPTHTIGTFGSAIGAIILNVDNKILLTKRKGDNEVNPGTWEIVFGRLNQNEGFEEALHREVKEEVGLKVEPVSIVGLMHFLRLGIEYNGVIFLCYAMSQNVKIQAEEIDEYVWVTIEEAIPLVEPYVQPHLEHIKSLILQG